MRARLSSFVCLAAVGATSFALTGCPDRTISELIPQQGRVEYKDIPITPNRNVDILFVIDDSPSMKDKQSNLATNFPRFIDVLDSIQGGRPNVHIGVVTSDLGTRGADGIVSPGIGTIGKGGCTGLGKGGNLVTNGAPVTGPYIVDIRGQMPNYTGNLTDVFATMARVGDGGCGFEQHLEAAKVALDNNPANANFLRPEAYLAIIVIADEDDCSMEHSTLLSSDTGTLGPRQSFRCTRFGVTCDQNGQTTDAMNKTGAKAQCHSNDNSAYLTKVSDYVTFLKGLKSDPRKVVVAGIMGTTDPFNVELRVPQGGGNAIPALAHSCTYIGGDINGDGIPDPEVADPPIRMQFFLDQFPNRSTFASICQQDLSGGLTQIGDLLKTVIGDPCIEGKLADVDAKTPGPQYDCSVSVVTNQGMTNQGEKILPACPAAGAGADPCWHLLTDTANCPNSDHFVLKIEHQDQLSMDAHIIANCVTE